MNSDYLKQEIKNYFEISDTENEQNKTKIIKCYTVTGLCCHLGISRSEFDELAEEQDTKEVILKAKLAIENFIEENMLNGKISASAAVIALKYNFNWTDKYRQIPTKVEIVVANEEELRYFE
jgi:hypothetical protein